MQRMGRIVVVTCLYAYMTMFMYICTRLLYRLHLSFKVSRLCLFSHMIHQATVNLSVVTVTPHSFKGLFLSLILCKFKKSASKILVWYSGTWCQVFKTTFVFLPPKNGHTLQVVLKCSNLTKKFNKKIQSSIFQLTLEDMVSDVVLRKGVSE